MLLGPRWLEDAANFGMTCAGCGEACCGEPRGIVVAANVFEDGVSARIFRLTDPGFPPVQTPLP
jgi:hypothetical protein